MNRTELAHPSHASHPGGSGESHVANGGNQGARKRAG
jgi:hypothetical protein